METYEDAIEDMKNTSGIGHSFMKDFPGIILANDRASEKDDLLNEIDKEKACYLLNLDDMLEEMLSQRLVTYGYF